jgi:hypothetical protein
MAAHMAKQVRGLTAYDPLEKFDLGGFTQEQVAEFVPLAFGEPFGLSLRVSFVVGGGRLVRAKYHEDLQKWLSAALRELGFDEDRGAALGSQAAFKRQEDLAQNLCVPAAPRRLARTALRPRRPSAHLRALLNRRSTHAHAHTLTTRQTLPGGQSILPRLSPLCQARGGRGRRRRRRRRGGGASRAALARAAPSGLQPGGAQAHGALQDHDLYREAARGGRAGGGSGAH